MLIGSKHNFRYTTFRFFEWFILFVIFLNSIVLALYDYTDRESITLHNQIIDRLNSFFTVIYALEAVFKILAYGLVLH